MKWAVPFLLLLIFETLANFFSGLFYSFHNIIFFVFILALYGIGNYFWLLSLKGGSGLARGSVYFGVGVVLTTALIGMAFYSESIGLVKISGMFFGIGSIVLMSKE